MALLHARPGQPIALAPLGPALRSATTHALLKTNALELIRLVLKNGEVLPPHKVRGEVTLLCIEGTAEVSLDGRVCLLRPDELLLLPAELPHALRAAEDCSLLMTIQLPPGSPGSASSTG